MKKVIATLLLIGLLAGAAMVAVPQIGYACSCADPGTPENGLERADAVFAGRVLEVKEQRTLRGFLSKTVWFEVERTWKGMDDSQVIVRTGSGGGDCGYHFQQGHEYVVYASMSGMYGGEDELTAIICSRTSELAQADEDLQWLGAGDEPARQVDLSSGMRTLPLYAAAGAVVAALLVLALVLLRRRRGRARR